MDGLIKLIVKFLNKEANDSELEELENLLKHDKNVHVLNKFVKTQYLSIVSLNNYDVQKAKEIVKTRIKNKRKTQQLKMYKKTGLAAFVILFLGVMFFNMPVKDQIINTTEEQPYLIVAGNGKAILTLENGDELVLEKGENIRIDKIRGDGQKLTYKGYGKMDDPEKEQLYNFLTIPRGGQFFVELSDGSQVWLNSESKLKFPVAFMPGGTRHVELLYGEAYFKVSPSSNHQGSVFQVISKSQEIDVMGTEFNVRAYDEDYLVATTLVEGQIKIKKGTLSKILNPNEQAMVKRDVDEIEIQQIDVSQEISWMNGLFTFNENNLDEIMMILSRWYNVEVVFESAAKKKFVFTGILQKADSIEEILTLIAATSEGQIKYIINEGMVIIK